MAFGYFSVHSSPTSCGSVEFGGTMHIYSKDQAVDWDKSAMGFLSGPAGAPRGYPASFGITYVSNKPDIVKWLSELGWKEVSSFQSCHGNHTVVAMIKVREGRDRSPVMLKEEPKQEKVNDGTAIA